MAESFIVAGRESDARPLLETARDECPRDYVEHGASLIELANLQ